MTLETALPWHTDVPPISFRYGEESEPQSLDAWERTEHREGEIRSIVFTDPATRLSVTAQVQTFKSPQAYEWVLEFENNGPTDTPIVSDILPLDLSLPAAPDDKIRLNHSKGSACHPDDFLPLAEELPPGQSRRLHPEGGRSSNGVLPFMNLQQGDRGWILAVGWSGQWFAAFDRGDETLRIRAGMEHTRLYLRPGEKIRTPRILLIPWTGDDPIQGNNFLRRLILAHYTPRIDGEIALPPVCHNTMSVYYHTRSVGEETEKEAIARAADLGIEAYWLDACWYGSGGEWWQEVGNWRIRKEAFPQGLKPLGDEAHARGMKFILWFEPERVRNGTPIERAHPEYLLKSLDNPDNNLLNLGLPEARAHITDLISGIIADAGVDVYRQDFNFDPLPYWQAADPEDRIGITEIRHVEGLYLMWDELRRRHPGLLIDNCSSGGRRIDLETVSRSFPLWRSDFSDVGGPAHGRTLQIADQIQTAGLSRWVPLHTGPVWTFSPYDFRSAMAAGIVPYSNIRAEDFPAEEARRAFEELKSLRPYFTGDFYPLLPLTTAAHDWCAYQYHRPDLNAGCAVFLRRHQSPFPVMDAALKKIIPDGQYEVSRTCDFTVPAPQPMSGADLMNLAIRIDDMPGSVLLRYRRIGE